MSHHTYKFVDASFWLAYTNPEDILSNPRNNYGYSAKGEITTGQKYLELFETEEEMAAYIDLITNTPGWYYECLNRIPYPPNPNEWECPEPTDYSSLTDGM